MRKVGFFLSLVVALAFFSSAYAVVVDEGGNGGGVYTYTAPACSCCDVEEPKLVGYSFTVEPMYAVDTLTDGMARSRYLVVHPGIQGGKFANISWRDGDRTLSNGRTSANLFLLPLDPYMLWEVERQCEIDHGVVCVVIETVSFQ